MKQPQANHYGPSALVTPANVITTLRILAVIPTLALIRHHQYPWLAVGLWFAVTSSDSLDGWLARREGPTRSGALLDPTADKLIVAGGLLVLAARGSFSWWPVLVIVGREIYISFYRARAARRGISLPARRLGKYKSFVQYCTVGFAILPLTARFQLFQGLVLTLAVAMTLASGLQIVRDGWEAAPQEQTF